MRGAPGLRAGDRGTLAIDAVGDPLAFVVKRSEDGVLGLAFALDEAPAGKLREALRRSGQLRAA